MTNQHAKLRYGPAIRRGPRPEVRMNGYSARLGTRITGPVARRLRLLVVLRRQPLNRVLTELLDKNLPSLAELTEQLNRQGSDDN
jgi:hypothetical protein